MYFCPLCEHQSVKFVRNGRTLLHHLPERTSQTRTGNGLMDFPKLLLVRLNQLKSRNLKGTISLEYKVSQRTRRGIKMCSSPATKFYQSGSKFLRQILKIVSRATEGRDKNNFNLSLLFFEFFVNDLQLKHIMYLYWKSCTLQELTDCYNEFRSSLNMWKSLLIKVSICIC